VPQSQRLRELAIVFLRLGAIAFGGPAAHVALMDQEIVTRRGWMSRERLLDLLGITNLIPGPNSTELAIYIGYDRAGWRGLWLAGICFIAPAFGLAWGLAVIYDQSQSIPQVMGLFYGIKPVIIAIVGQALWKLGGQALGDRVTVAAAVGAGLGYGLGLPEIGLLLGLGLGVMVLRRWIRPDSKPSMGILPGLGWITHGPNWGFGSWRSSPGGFNPWGFNPWGLAELGATIAPPPPGPNLLIIFLFFLQVGSLLYGSGYVLLAFLQRGLVERTHWLTAQQLLDAVAVGQLTPGPVSTTATFIGYLLGGHGGAIVATVGIFLPAFVLVGLVHPLVARLQRSPLARNFLDGVNGASWGLMAAVTYTLARSALVDPLTWGIALASGLVLWRWQLNSAWLILAGGLLGLGVGLWG